MSLITDTAGLYDYQAGYTANAQSVAAAGTFSNSGAGVITESTTAPPVLGNRAKLWVHLHRRPLHRARL